MEAKWYRKLSSSGFVDIEKDDQPMVWHSRYFINQYGHEEFGEKQRYFERTTALESEDIFIDQVEKAIWKMHSNGIPIRTIVEMLKKKGIKRNKNQVNQIINDLQEVMAKI